MPALLEFLTDLIAAEGGVVEWRGGYERCEALVPEPLQRALGLPEPLVAIEEGELGGQGPAATRIAFGSELLERAMGAAAARGATAAVRAPPPSAAKLVSSGLPRSVSVLNGVSDVAGERPGWRDYWLWSFHTVAEADERQDGVTHACVSSTGAGCTEVGQLLADEVGYLEPFQPDASAWRSAELAALYVAAAARALGQLRLDSEEFCSGVRRR
ncbi:MAG: hypothetical protein HY744_20250 [Deltaproteobacteria bacterium]|nr:hypothetical protein [Deltaproteobacteria bacterium]